MLYLKKDSHSYSACALALFALIAQVLLPQLKRTVKFIEKASDSAVKLIVKDITSAYISLTETSLSDQFLKRYIEIR